MVVDNTSDLAITEAAAGICTTVLMMVSYSEPVGRRNSDENKNLFLLVLLLATYGILIAVAELPPYGT